MVEASDLEKSFLELISDLSHMEIPRITNYKALQDLLMDVAISLDKKLYEPIRAQWDIPKAAPTIESIVQDFIIPELEVSANLRDEDTSDD